MDKFLFPYLCDNLHKLSYCIYFKSIDLERTLRSSLLIMKQSNNYTIEELNKYYGLFKNPKYDADKLTEELCYLNFTGFIIVC